MKLGILKEGKVPPDKRVPLTPQQCKTLLNLYPELRVEVQSSHIRCFSDDEYKRLGLTVKDDISSCDMFLGVKEASPDDLIPDKSYMFFSHTIKQQAHNKRLLQTVLERRIRLIDYELMTDAKGMRLIGFGRYAGLVGAYNALLTYGKKFGLYNLKPAHLCSGKAEIIRELKKVRLSNARIAVTGNGRVANGVMEIMEELAIRRLSVSEYLSQTYDEPVYVQLAPGDYTRHREGRAFELFHFFRHPGEYIENFTRFIGAVDILISAAYWDPKAPKLFTLKDAQTENFAIKVIADITCDIGGSIPSTIRASSIDQPHYDFNVYTGVEEPAFSSGQNITVMAIDNLPCELPRDASHEFGDSLVNRILESVIKYDREGIIERATIAEGGHLKERFKYLKDYAQRGNKETVN